MAIHPHGAGSTNLIFMLPHSYLLEIFPPYLYIDTYAWLSVGTDIVYDYIISPGDYPPSCLNLEPTQKCPKSELRDRLYNANVSDVIIKVDAAIPLIQNKKYPSIWKD